MEVSQKCNLRLHLTQKQHKRLGNNVERMDQYLFDIRLQNFGYGVKEVTANYR